MKTFFKVIGVLFLLGLIIKYPWISVLFTIGLFFYLRKSKKEFKENTLVESNSKTTLSLIKKVKDFEVNGSEFIVLDLETTGLSSDYDRIVEVAVVKFSNLELVEIFHTLVNPKRKIPTQATNINGITDSMVKNKPTIYKILPDLLDFIGDYPIVAHNAMFDVGFIKNACKRHFKDESYWIKNKIIDTVKLSRTMFPNLPNHKLGTVSSHLGIEIKNQHRATDDALATAQIYIEYLNYLEREKQARIASLDEEEKKASDIVKDILIKNERNLDLFEIRQTSKYFDLCYFYTFLRLKLKGRKQYILSDYNIEDFKARYGDSYTIEECPKSENAKSRIIITSINELESMEKIILDSFDDTVNSHNEYLNYKNKDTSYTKTYDNGITITVSTK